MTIRYQVLCSNIGTVYLGVDKAEADEAFNHYVALSRHDMGRVSGETVSMLEGTTLLCESVGSLYLDKA